MAKAKVEKAPVLVSGPVHILKASQWKDMPDLQVQLQQLLDNPIFKMACLSLLVTAMPNARPVTELAPGVSAEAMALVANNSYHNRSGFTQFYRALHGLARAKNKPKVNAEFGELLPESE